MVGKVRWLDFGAGPGVTSDSIDVPSKYKQGWTNASRTIYLCGRILNQQKDLALTQDEDVGYSNYFPAYRSGDVE